MPDTRAQISRRDFIKAAGIAAGAVTLADAVGPAGADLDPGRKVRIGVVGGGFGAAFQWHLDPNCTVEAVSDLRPDRRKHLQNVYKCEKAYESLEKLVLDPAVDAVAVFTGAPDHVRHVVECMNHGKHVISAVPAATSLEECHTLKEIKERTGLKYMMAETSYYRPECILARELYEDGKFGDFIYSEVEYYHNMTGGERDSLWFWDGKRTWRYGYPPMLYPTHSTAFHVGVTGERLVKVSCLGSNWYDEDCTPNVYDNPFMNQASMCQASGGNICRCNVFWGVHAGGERAQWIGQNAAMYMAGSSGQPFVAKINGEPDINSVSDYFHLLPEPMRVASGHGNSHAFITHEFIAALVEDREPSVNLYEAIAMTAPGIVAMESCRKGGEQLQVPSFDKA